MEEVLIEAIDLKKYFKFKHGLLKAVDGVSLRVLKGQTVALVGESGCGKSTVARLLLRLIEPTSGRILFKGRDLMSLKGNELMAFRRAVQIVFQDPFASLNPRMSVLSILSEPLKIHRIVPKNEIRDYVAGLLKSVGLSPDAMNKYPHEFSGGQRQRICIARALSVAPELLVADEPLSSLDVSVQAQILNLLETLKAQKGLAYLFISHDLRVVHYFSDYVMVMYLGRIVEEAPAERLFTTPFHPYTMLLLESIPSITKPRTKRLSQMVGVPKYSENFSNQDNSGVPKKSKMFWGNRSSDLINVEDNYPGCPFAPRCPKRFEPCEREIPVLKRIGDTCVACHLY